MTPIDNFIPFLSSATVPHPHYHPTFSSPATPPSPLISSQSRAISIISAHGEYARLVLLPLQLSCDYSFPVSNTPESLNEPRPAQAIGGYFAVLAAAAWATCTRSLILWTAVLFAVVRSCALLPVDAALMRCRSPLPPPVISFSTRL